MAETLGELVEQTNASIEFAEGQTSSVATFWEEAAPVVQAVHDAGDEATQEQIGEALRLAGEAHGQALEAKECHKSTAAWMENILEVLTPLQKVTRPAKNEVTFRGRISHRGGSGFVRLGDPPSLAFRVTIPRPVEEGHGELFCSYAMAPGATHGDARALFRALHKGVQYVEVTGQLDPQPCGNTDVIRILCSHLERLPNDDS